MFFDSIIGQPWAVELARRWLEQKTNHPMLFYGPRGVGKRTLALEVAKALNQEERKIAAGIHPDVHVLDLEFQTATLGKNAPKQLLGVDIIEAEQHRLFQSPVEGRHKVLIVRDALLLSQDAANKLLKLLEEPPLDVSIILIATERERLLPTVISRCRPVRFKRLSMAEMHSWWDQQLGSDPNTHKELILALSHGSPGRAHTLMDPDTLQAFQEAEALWQALPRQSPVELAAQGEGRSKGNRLTRADAEEKLFWLQTAAFRAHREGDGRGTHALERFEGAFRQLRQNVAPGLVYDNLLLHL